MLVKLVFLVFSLTEILVIVGVVLLLHMLSCFPTVKQQFSYIVFVYKTFVHSMSGQTCDKVDAFQEESTWEGQLGPTT